jgi:hypothetical protein
MQQKKEDLLNRLDRRDRQNNTAFDILSFILKRPEAIAQEHRMGYSQEYG